jgi:hypothetical protein
MDTINTLMHSRGLRMRLNLSTRVPTEVEKLSSDLLINSFEVEVEVEVDV